MINKIGIIDYKAGNAPSVLNALNRLGVPSELITAPEQLSGVRAVILPGVGAARATINSLNGMGILDVLKEHVVDGGLPFLGICVGLQILFDHSEEEDTPCLGWIPGRVKRFSEGVRVPQMGWNRVDFKSGGHGYFYFVNSYYAVPDDPADIAATTDYGVAFCSMVKHNNITATQFHLEKSGEAGLELLYDFAKEAGVC